MKNDMMQKIYKKNGKNLDSCEGLKIYNLGCGKQNFKQAIGVDKVNLEHIQIKHDLNIVPWPIPDNDADLIVAFQFFEHVDDLLQTLNEMCRISKNGARIIIDVPHFRYSSAFKDPTHKHFFTGKTINYFVKTNHSFTELPFKIKLVRLSIGWPANNPWTIKYWVKRWINKHLNFYDNFLYFFIQAKMISFELEVIK